MSKHTPFPWGRGENTHPALSSPPACALYGKWSMGSHSSARTAHQAMKRYANA